MMLQLRVFVRSDELVTHAALRGPGAGQVTPGGGQDAAAGHARTADVTTAFFLSNDIS
jgi:hypothetical protein